MEIKIKYDNYLMQHKKIKAFLETMGEFKLEAFINLK